jgi:hypothetical protein
MGNFELFSTDSNSESNFAFYYAHIEFKKYFFAYISTFLWLTLKPKSDERARKTKYI